MAQVINIAEEVRMCIGNDLHDGIGQMLTGIISLTEALEANLDGEALRDATRIRLLVKETIQQVRELSHSLSPAAVENCGLATALRQLASRVKNRFLACEVEVDFEPRLDNLETLTHLFRIAQEAVNNALKHANPKQITISLKRISDNCCLMTIHDDGIGINPRKTRLEMGIGMRVMRYRADNIGGTLELGPRRGGGTEVNCRFPCAYA